ncbi:hypothetical protein K2173_006669 [Erythroxylum novogranatense]|uniref:La-related protein 6A n=1 Tax=Erythroxylum novogranatense TaxID=1862640 RepID=A0AAV8T5K6_9ROSI|nr:hypothetical protein K2173_006669 [Erythroxylum novogranatense]
MDGETGPTDVPQGTSSPPPQVTLVGTPEVSFAEIHASRSDEDYDHDEDPDHGHVQTQDLKRRIIKQVEYYFSDENLATDKHMISLIKKHKDGFVPISIIASFRKMKKLTRDITTTVDALRESSFLVVSSDGKKVKRLHPFPLNEVKDPKLCTVLVENLPNNHSEDDIQKIFGGAGKIQKISIHDPHAVEESKKGGKSDILISNKVHAIVEYDSVEAAERSVATLNNEQDWRNGMRVKLITRVGKYGTRKQSWREHDSEKNGAGHASSQTGDEVNHNFSEHPSDTPEEEVVDHLSKEKKVQQARNRRTRKNKHHPTNGMGHGTTHAVEPSKPPPGPKMPDGTRGFTMGRGRPPLPN